MSRESHESCPECKSLNTERKGRMIDGVPVSTLFCHHCKGQFRKVHNLRSVKCFPGVETVSVTWCRI